MPLCPVVCIGFVAQFRVFNLGHNYDECKRSSGIRKKCFKSYTKKSFNGF